MSRVKDGFFYPVIFLVANFCHCQKYFGKRIFCEKFFAHLKKNAQKKKNRNNFLQYERGA